MDDEQQLNVVSAYEQLKSVNKVDREFVVPRQLCLTNSRASWRESDVTTC